MKWSNFEGQKTKRPKHSPLAQGEFWDTCRLELLETSRKNRKKERATWFFFQSKRGQDTKIEAWDFVFDTKYHALAKKCA